VGRYTQVITVKRERVAAYERIHAQLWPEVLAMILKCNIRNYPIVRYQALLIAYLEYVGEDFAADIDRTAADPKTGGWWAITHLMQEPMSERAAAEWWKRIPEVFHTDQEREHGSGSHGDDGVLIFSAPER
jgi:L-rhamnose mutarotase